MTDFNDAVVSNIKIQMKKRRTKQTELADMTVFHADVRKGIKAAPGYEGCKDGFGF